MIFGICGMLNPEKIWRETLQICPPHLSDVATLPWEIQKSHFQQYNSYIFLIIYVISEKKQTLSHLPTSPDMTSPH